MHHIKLIYYQLYKTDGIINIFFVKEYDSNTTYLPKNHEFNNHIR